MAEAINPAYIAHRMSHEGYHESAELLTESTKNLHRALVSLQEELEAVDWYQQRADVCKDDALRAILLHNRNEEIEHAMMVLEWIRRKDPVFDAHARTYLFSTAPVTEVEEAVDKGGNGDGAERPAPKGAGAPPTGGSLRVGSLRSA